MTATKGLVLVIGGSGGIGSAVCTRLAADGYDVALSYNANKRPERMSKVQGVLDQLADEAAAKCNPADLEE